MQSISLTFRLKALKSTFEVMSYFENCKPSKARAVNSLEKCNPSHLNVYDICLLSEMKKLKCLPTWKKIKQLH